MTATILAGVLCGCAGLILGTCAGMSWQWRRDRKRIPPDTVALIYKREPTPDEVAYAKELEATFRGAGDRGSG